MKMSCSIHGAVTVVILAVQLSAAWAGEPQLPSNLDLGVACAIPVQHDGRWMPLDTLARDMVKSVTGQKSYRGQDSVLLLLAWTFDPQVWMQQPLIAVDSAELRGILQLSIDRSEFSFAELARHKPLQQLIDQFSHQAGRKKPDALESKVKDIHTKLVQLQDIFENDVIRPVPHATDAMGAWTPIGIPKDGGKSKASVVQAAWLDLQSSFLANNSTQFADASRRLAAGLAELPAAHHPVARTIATELRYNRLHPYSLAWRIMVAGAVLALLAVWIQRGWMDVLVVAVAVTGFGVLSYGMWLRWQIAGRIPAANMFESLLFLSWGAGAFAIVSLLFMRDRLMPLTASAIGALALCLADMLPIDHFIRPIAPVLMDTVWMSIHVPGIMVSYAVLALAALIAHVQIVAMVLTPSRRTLIDKLEAMHYWYMHVGTILLGAGIITGSMWAASSWGRYWGWDPKEVWSLIAFIAYLVILHVRVDREVTPAWIYGVGLLLTVGLFVAVVPLMAPLSLPMIVSLATGVVLGAVFVLVRGRFAVAFKSAVAFWSIIMTYVGVNFVLNSGLHSYGFGTGAVAHNMMLIGSIDLGLVGLLTIVYLARSDELASMLGAPAARPSSGTNVVE